MSEYRQHPPEAGPPPTSPIPPTTPSYAPTAYPTDSFGRPQKPGQVTAIAIMCLVSGIFDCLGVVTILMCWPFGIFSLIVGILEIIYATKILSDPIRTSHMNRTVAILQIINILNFMWTALVVGIISLVFYSDPKVQAYFHEIRCRGLG